MTTAPIHAFEDVWNDAGTLFYGIQLDVTDTASNASSKLIQLDINGSTEFSVQKDGETFIGGMLYATSGGQFVGNFSGDPVFTGDPAFTGSPDFSGVGNAATIRSDLGVAVGSDVQAWSADLDTYAANPLTAAELGELQNIGTTTISAAQWSYLGASTAFGASLLDDADAAAGRTTLGLGTIATQNANSVTITGGSISGITDLAIADGGTGASNTSDARDNLISSDTGLDFIENYGPAGDGSTDDATPVTNALSGASGQTLLVSPNTYTVLRSAINTAISIPANTYIQGLGGASTFEMDVNSTGTYELFAPGEGVHISGITFDVDAVSGSTPQILRPTGDNQLYSFNKFQGNATFSGGSANYIVQCIDFSGGANIDGLTSLCNDYSNINRVFLKVNSDTNSQTKLKFIGDRVKDCYTEAMAFNNPNGTMQDILAFGISFEDSPRRVHALGGACIEDARFAFNCITGTGDELAHFEEAGRRLVHMGSTAEFTDAVSGTYYGPNDYKAQEAQTITAISAANDTITINGHGLRDGDKVVYRVSGGSEIGGLTDGGASGTPVYYVIDSTLNTFKLSSTVGGSAIDITGSLPSGTHTIALRVFDNPKYAAEGYNVLGLSDDRQTITALSESGDTLTIAGHGYDNNQQVIYRNTGTTDIGGLEDGLIYFVRNPTTDTFQLSATAGGSAIALDTTPDDTLPAGTHTIQALGTGFLYANTSAPVPPAEYAITSNNVAYGWGRGIAFPSKMQNNLFVNNIFADCDYGVFGIRPTLALRDNMSVEPYAYHVDTQASGIFGKHSFRRARDAAYSANVTGVSESADTLSFSSHDFSDGDRVFYVYRDPDSTGGNAVPGLTSGTAYYVVGATSTTIQLATEPGGSAIALNASGGTTLPNGDHRVSKWEGIEPFIHNPIRVASTHVAGFEAWDMEIDPVVIPDMASGESWAIMPIGERMVGRMKVMLSSSNVLYQLRVSDVKWDGTTFTEFVSMETPVDVQPISQTATSGSLPDPSAVVYSNAASPTNSELLEGVMALRKTQNDLTTPEYARMETGAGAIDLFDIREDNGNLCIRLNNTLGSDASARIQVIFDGIHVFT